MSKPFGSTELKIAVGSAALLALAAFSLAALPHGASHAKPDSRPGVASTQASAQQRSQVRATLSALPLAFEANQGQSDPQVKYMARGNGYTLFLTSNDAVFSVRSASKASTAASRFERGRGLRRVATAEEKTAAIHMQMLGAKANPQIAMGEVVPGVINYYRGNDRSQWIEGVKQYASVNYRDVYPGVDVAYHGKQRQLEFDFIIAPGASAAPIKLGFSGANKIATDDSGNLVLASDAGNVLLHKPVAYQEKDGHREPVEVAFEQSGREVGFTLGSYDHSLELVIDPTLTYATYLGGNNEDEVFGLAIDPSNNVYVTGESKSTSGFPGGDATSGDGFDVFVTSLTSSGALAYTSFVGGSNNDSGYAIAVDASGAAYVTGITESTNFPVSGTAAQSASGGGGNCTNTKQTSAPCSDGFAMKLNATTGTRAWSTYLGGSNDDDGYGIALDHSGNVWVVGDTFSNNFFPIFHATTVLYSSFNNSVVLSPPADDGFVVGINSSGTAFIAASYLGGSFGDQVNGIAIDGTDNLYVTGETASTDFPVKNPYQSGCGSDGHCNAHSGLIYYDAFVTKIAAGGASLVYSTYIGGSSDDYGFAIAVDSAGDAYITGETTQDDPSTTPAVAYPTTSGAFSTTYKGGAGGSNAFVTEFNASGSALTYSTFLGGSTNDLGGGISLDSFKDAYVTGSTLSTDFPTTSNALQTQLNGNGSTGHSDAFVTQILAGGANLGFSTYLGGSGDENANASGAVGAIALDSANNMWVGGSTNSATANSTTNFPVTTGALESTFGGNPYDGFVAEISNATSPDFTVAATTPSSVSPGSSATSNVTVTALFNYSSAVTLSCSVTGSGSPAPSCSASGAFSTNPVMPTAGGAPSTLTITTTGSSAAIYRHSNMLYAMWLPIVGLTVIGVSFSSKDSRRKKLLGFVMLGIVMAMLFFLPACGGGSSSGGGGGGCSGCTPTGSYTVTISGAAGGVTHSTAVTLTVN